MQLHSVSSSQSAAVLARLCCVCLSHCCACCACQHRGGGGGGRAGAGTERSAGTCWIAFARASITRRVAQSAPCWIASDCRNEVFPVPGGPYRRKILHGTKSARSDTDLCYKRRGHVVQRPRGAGSASPLVLQPLLVVPLSSLQELIHRFKQRAGPRVRPLLHSATIKGDSEVFRAI